MFRETGDIVVAVRELLEVSENMYISGEETVLGDMGTSKYPSN